MVDADFEMNWRRHLFGGRKISTKRLVPGACVCARVLKALLSAAKLAFFQVALKFKAPPTLDFLFNGILCALSQLPIKVENRQNIYFNM